MKRTVVFMVAAAFFLSTGIYTVDFSLAQEPEREVVKTEKSGIRELISRMWSRLRMLSPKRNKAIQDSAVAGVKGAEKGSEELKPYWAGEEQSSDNLGIEQYISAESLMEEGKYSEAIIAFDSFRETFKGSKYEGNAIFSTSLCYLQIEQEEAAAKALDSFISSFPDHELTGDAIKLRESIKEKADK